MTIELDHLFICTAAGAPEAERLMARGLTEGTRNVHPGQGTACRRFFFHNTMLELLWVDDVDAARSALIAPTRLWERWRYRQTGNSPFGICVRLAGQKPARPAGLPFATWDYCPPYLPPGTHIDIATNSAVVGEPLIFATPFGSRPDSYPPDRRQPLEHAIGVREMTALRITLPRATAPSAALQSLQQAGVVTLVIGSDHCIEISFDYERQGQVADFRPELPLRLRW